MLLLVKAVVAVEGESVIRPEMAGQAAMAVPAQAAAAEQVVLVGRVASPLSTTNGG